MDQLRVSAGSGRGGDAPGGEARAAAIAQVDGSVRKIPQPLIFLSRAKSAVRLAAE